MVKFLLFLYLVISCYSTPALAKECHEVQFNHQTIVCLSSGVGAISSEQRAAYIQNKITDIANNYNIDPKSLELTKLDQSFVIKSGNNVIIALSEKDYRDDIEGNLEQQSLAVLSKITTSIEAYRADRSYNVLIKAFAYSVLSILAFWALMLILNKLQKISNIQIEKVTPQVAEKLTIRSYRLIPAHRLQGFIVKAVSFLKMIFVVIGLYLLVTTILSFFPWTVHLSDQILDYLLTPLKKVLSGVINYIPDLVYVGAIFIVTHFFLKFVAVLFEEIKNETIQFSNFPSEWAAPTYKLVVFLFYIVAFVMAFPYLPGSSSPAFQGLSVFIGVLVSFGSGSAISNVISGIVLTYMRPFKIGDRVRIADTQGDIIEKTFLVTRVRTIKNVDITIPNSMVLGSHIVNFSSSAKQDGLILNTTVTIGYDAPWVKVQELLKEAARRTDLVDKEKEPFILQTALNDFYVSYELNVYTKNVSKMAKIYSDLHQNIQDTFNEGGIEIMSPHYGAHRDGNETTIPRSYRASDYKVPSFRLNKFDRD